MTETTLWCSFCGKSQNEVQKLVAGGSGSICNECIDLCGEIMTAEGITKPLYPELRKWAWHVSALALSSHRPTIADLVEYADAAVAYASPARLLPVQNGTENPATSTTSTQLESGEQAA